MSTETGFELSTTLHATATQVLFAFLDRSALRSWWGARNVVVQPRPGGLLVVEWEVGHGGEDALLGPQGGVLAGMLDRSMAGHFVHFGNLHLLTPRGETFGPTRLEVDVFSKGDPMHKPTLLRLRATGFQEGERWQRYLDLTRRSWERTIGELKKYCETQAPAPAESTVTGLGGTYLAEAAIKGRHIS
jgi:hypothetical protein